MRVCVGMYVECWRASGRDGGGERGCQCPPCRMCVVAWDMLGNGPGANARPGHTATLHVLLPVPPPPTPQAIRHMLRDTTVVSWRSGAPVPGTAWVPYQEPTVVTPPFPDFPSGHSHFSRAFANVMRKWFPRVGPTLMRRRVPLFDSHVVSPVLTQPGTLDAVANRTACLVFTVGQGCSRVQPGAVPGTSLVCGRGEV